MINKVIKTARGFTLIETLVAVLLLATAIAGPLTIASKSLIAALVAKDQVTAFFLAQDAVEYIRFIRDSNKLRGADWIDGTGGSIAGIDMSDCESAAGCYVDSTGNTVDGSNNIAACSSTCPLMRYGTLNDGNEANDRFRYNPTSANEPNTTFRRTIMLTPGSFAEETILTVTVTWNTTAGVTRTVTVKENMFDWQ